MSAFASVRIVRLERFSFVRAGGAYRLATEFAVLDCAQKLVSASFDPARRCSPIRQSCGRFFNHPPGGAEPSAADRAATGRLKAAPALIGRH
jgi:hypothetical protein